MSGFNLYYIYAITYNSCHMISYYEFTFYLVV